MNRTRLLWSVAFLSLVPLSGACLQGDPNPYYAAHRSGEASSNSDESTSSDLIPMSADVARGNGREPIAPGTECSPRAGAKTMVVFQNGYPERDLELFWVGFDCVERSYGTITAGSSLSQSTYVGHVWRLRARGELYHEYVAEELSNQLVPLP